VSASTSPIVSPPWLDTEGRGVDERGRLARLPALDGLRGIGQPMLMLYHHGLALFGWWFHGSILCVSMFFTLSGFLITRLLLQEHAGTGRISLPTFYSRRIRRLMPVALTVALLVAVIWTIYPSASRSLDFTAFFWMIFYGTNLLLIHRGNSYQNLFADQSPLQHTWSLSLEEQIYFVFPLAMFGILSWRRTRRFSAGVILGLAAISFGLAWMWATIRGGDRPYYATEARASEFLVGAATAVFWVRSPHVPRISSWIRSRAGTIVGYVVLAAAIWLWYLVGLTNFYLFRGATILNSLLVATLMGYACAAPASGVCGLLGAKPLVAIGRRAYVLYLAHWPVFVLLTPTSTGLSSEPLLVVRFAVAFAVGEVLFRFVEGPILRQRVWSGRTLYRGCAFLAAVALAIAAFAPASASNALLDPEALALQRQLLLSLPQITDADPTRAAGDPTLPARVLTIGDSQSLFVANGMSKMWGKERGVDLQYAAGVACGTAQLTPIRYLGEELLHGRSGCKEWRENLSPILERYRPQVVILVGGFADLADHQINGTWQHIGEPAYDEWLHEQMVTFAELAHSTGARVLWLTSPDIDVPNPAGVNAYPEEDPARMDRYNEMIQGLADELAYVDTADLATFVQDRPGGQFDTTFRPDGAHMILETAPDVVAFLAAAIVESTSHVP